LITVVHVCTDVHCIPKSEHNYCTFTLGLLHESHLDVVVNELNSVSGKWESLEKQLGMDKLRSYIYMWRSVYWGNNCKQYMERF